MFSSQFSNLYNHKIALAQQSHYTNENTIECSDVSGALREADQAEEAGRRREGIRGAGARPLQRWLGLRLCPSVGGKTIAPLGQKAQDCLPEMRVPDGAYSTECTIPPAGRERRDTESAGGDLTSSQLCSPPSSVLNFLLLWASESSDTSGSQDFGLGLPVRNTVDIAM